MVLNCPVNWTDHLDRACNEYITTDTCRKYIREYVSNVCQLFCSDEVWYRTTELVAAEINSLKGVDNIIIEKEHYLGMRGIRRAIKYPDTFTLELVNLNQISNEYKNLNVLFPFIYDPKELEKSLEILNKVKFNGKYGIMAEIPSTILLLDKFAELGISNITIGVNDLTSLTLGFSRGENSNHTHKAVIKLIEMAVNVGHKYNIPVSLGGYVSNELKSICEEIGLDTFIIHYNALSEILNIPSETLEYSSLHNKLTDRFL